MMDAENQRRTEELGAKVNRLKHLTLDMDKDVKDSNNYLNNMGFDFASTSSLIKGGVTRVTGMMGTGKSDRKVMCYLIIGMVLGFFFFYKLLLILRS